MMERAMDTRDNAALNLFILAAVTAAALGLRSGRLASVRQRILEWKPYIIGILSLFICVISMVWVVNSHVAPGGDGGPLCGVAERMVTGNYIDMKPKYHMAIFPHQFGLLSVIHLIFSLFGAWPYEVFQYLNALCMPLLFYSGYKFLEIICDTAEVILYYAVFFLGCLPMFLYVPFVYGEIMSITFTMVLMWQVLRYCRTGRRSCFVWGTAAIVLACIVRKNSLILLIAAGIVLAVHSVKKASLWGIAWFLVMALAVSGSDRLIQAHYEKVSGIEVAGGVPYISWVRMGLQDSWAGPGWFDNTSIEVYKEHGYDTELTAAAERERLGEMLEEMWEDKASAVDFFRRKILSQWNAPEYSSVVETKQFDCELQELRGFARRIYYENDPAVWAYMDRYQFLLYFYAAVSAVLLFADRKRGRCLAEYILYIAIVGGFLFSAVWESSSRYVIPYVVYMIPLAAVGMCLLTRLLAEKIPGRTFLRKIFSKSDIKKAA